MVASLDFPEGGSRQHFDDTGGDAHVRVVHQVDVTDAGWQIPFVTSVVNTYASWRAEFAAEVCPTNVA